MNTLWPKGCIVLALADVSEHSSMNVSVDYEGSVLGTEEKCNFCLYGSGNMGAV